MKVLIYAHHLDAETKREISESFSIRVSSERTGILSTQVLQDFYGNVTRQHDSPSKNSARLLVDRYRLWCIEKTPAKISAGFRI